MDKKINIVVAAGIGLEASCGFSVFVPLLVSGFAARADILPLNNGFKWMAGWSAIICLCTVTVLEILAYYIPVVDNLPDTKAIPLSVSAGTLLIISVLHIDNEIRQKTKYLRRTV